MLDPKQGGYFELKNHAILIQKASIVTSGNELYNHEKNGE